MYGTRRCPVWCWCNWRDRVVEPSPWLNSNFCRVPNVNTRTRAHMNSRQPNNKVYLLVLVRALQDKAAKHRQ
eukprot:scaffold500321_cov24-Prasinocladus_malaysianus.AAC.1